MFQDVGLSPCSSYLPISLSQKYGALFEKVDLKWSENWLLRNTRPDYVYCIDNAINNARELDTNTA